MANITAKDVAELRARTGVGMMDCKKALVETDGDMEKAIVVLRERGLAAAAKKAGRIAAEGIVVSFVDSTKGVGCVLEVNSETDFVAKNSVFIDFAKAVAQTVIDQSPADIDALLNCKASGSDMTVEELLRDKILVIGENLKVRRFERLEGILVPYVHGEGRIGVMVKLDASGISADNAELLACGKDIALQVAASAPLYMDTASVPADALDKEREIMLAQLEADPKYAGKPTQVIDKIMAGKVDKYCKEICLMDQAFVKDGDVNVKQYLENCSKSIGVTVSVATFVRFERGEGLQKKEDNFADEVANMVK